MQKFGCDNLLPYNLELERTVRRIQKEKREAENLLQQPMENLQGIREEEEDVNSRSGDSSSPSATPIVQSPRALRDYALPPMGVSLVIRRPIIQANTFELKPITLQLIQNIQFMGLPQEDPNTHISNFLEVCDIVKYNGVSEDVIRLRLFPFSLKDKAKH